MYITGVYVLHNENLLTSYQLHQMYYLFYYILAIIFRKISISAIISH